MKVLRPTYYNDFKCIGTECKDSCCIGWRVDIDKKSYNKYKKIKGEFGLRLNKSISRNRSSQSYLRYGKINLENGSCPMLNEDSLCDLYINAGESYLCNTCKSYPRSISKYNDICEKSLTLSCPEFARIFVDFDEAMQFEIVEESLDTVERDYINDKKYTDSLYNLLWEGRSFSIDLAQFKEIPMWKRLIFIKLTQEKLQNLLDKKDYKNYEAVIELLKETVTSQETIKSLDNIESVSKVKLLFIKAILQNKVNEGISNKTFKKIIDYFNELVRDKSEEDILGYIQDKEIKFEEYFKEYDYIIENYIVYNLYNNYFKAIEGKDLNKEIVRLILSYSLIKIFLLATWVKNDEVLTKEDIIDVLYSFSRTLEHSEVFIEKIYSNIKEAGYDSIAYLTILAR